MIQVMRNIVLGWGIGFEIGDQDDKEWIIENRPQLWEEATENYSSWNDANAVLEKIKQALAERES